MLRGGSSAGDLWSGWWIIGRSLAFLEEYFYSSSHMQRLLVSVLHWGRVWLVINTPAEYLTEWKWVSTPNSRQPNKSHVQNQFLDKFAS